MKKEESPATKILLVDGHTLGSNARKTILIDHGYEAQTAVTGEEAWELFRKIPFDIVITEYRLKGMNGGELIRLIRESNSPARVILLAGLLSSSGFTRKNTGADELIAKGENEVSDLLRIVGKLSVRPRRRAPGSQRRPDASRQAGIG